MIVFKKDKIPGRIEERPFHTFNIYLPCRAYGRTVYIIIDDEELRVEAATTHLLELSDYTVLNGAQIHLAGHVLTGKFMAPKDCIVFKNWTRSYKFKEDYLDSILAESDELLQAYMKGDDSCAPKLLANLIDRWDAYNKPVERRREEIRILADFWLANRELFRKWVEWYSGISYDSAGAPDLFSWDPGTNNWCWVEAKAPGDRLHANQWRWINKFTKHIAPNVDIVNVLPEDYKEK